MLFITTEACKAILPHCPYASPISHPYDVIFPWWLHLISMSMDASVSNATKMIIRRPGMRPSILMLAGKAMIPAPTMVVERLKTAPENEAPLNSWNPSSSTLTGRSGVVSSRISLRAVCWFTSADPFPTPIFSFTLLEGKVINQR